MIFPSTMDSFPSYSRETTKKPWSLLRQIAIEISSLESITRASLDMIAMAHGLFELSYA